MGKTTLLFNLMDTFRSAARIAFLFQTQCSSRELLQYLFSELGADTPGYDIVGMHEEFNEVLLAEFRAGRRVLIVIDEAQNLQPSVLETVRLLSDFETASTKLVQIVIAGQPQLAEKLAQPELKQLRQRISILSRLNVFDSEDVKAYIHHRLAVAGYSGTGVFDPAALELIATSSDGIPRNINTLCFNAMSMAFALGKTTIDYNIVHEVIVDLTEAFKFNSDSSACHSRLWPTPSGEETLSESERAKLTTESDARLDLIAKEAKELTGASGAAIGLKRGSRIVCCASAGSTAPDLGVELDAESGISGKCIQTGQIVHCPDTARDALVDKTLCRHLGIRSIVGVPVYRDEDVIGLIEITAERRNAFHDEEVCRLRRIADSIFDTSATQSDVSAFEPRAPVATAITRRMTVPRATSPGLSKRSLQRNCGGG
jgi:type II secretory pathway predicted ATPase ExeA